MGFFFRKRKNFGPFALNFSTKGVGLSTGITGARLSFGPNGTFIHLGRQGFYYRKKVGRFSEGTRNKLLQSENIVQETNQNKIESADIKNFQSSSSDKLLKEIQQKNSLIKYSSISLIISIIILLITFNLNSPPWLSLILIILSVGSYSYFFKKDVERKTVTISYELDKEIKNSFEKMNKGFEELNENDSLWRIETQQKTDDWKRNSGASSLVNRKLISIFNELPPFLDSNIIPYGFKVDNKSYYFFPDRILIYQKKEVGSVVYNELKVNNSITRFIESENVPKDSEIVGNTWRYLNKDGSPDKRFNNNHQIPIVLYSEIDLQTSSGINLKFQTSNKKSGEIFLKHLEPIKNLKIGKK